MSDRVILPGIDLGAGDEGQERLERLKKLAAKAGFYHGGQPSIGRYIKSLSDTSVEPMWDGLNARFLDRVKSDNRYALDDLEDAIQIRRHQIMADALQSYGIKTQLKTECEDSGYVYWFNYILVINPDRNKPDVFANWEECKRLLDTVRNLPPAEAFIRWKEKVNPIEREPYDDWE